MGKYQPPPLVIAAIFAITGLGIYGIKSWYFPGRATWFLMVPLAAIGIALAIGIYPRIEHLYSGKARKMFARLFMMLLVPLFVCAAFGLGAPALVLRILGPDTQLTAIVADKKERFRRCRQRVYLVDDSRSHIGRICVSNREFERLQEGQQVSLGARAGLFGTFVFSIEPA